MENNAPTPAKLPAGTSVSPTGRNAPQPHETSTEIVFPWKVPGNNGAGGLLRMHWSKKKSLLVKYWWQVTSTNTHRHAGPVRLELIRYSTGRPMDYDNLVSTGKLLLDAVVRAGVLPDDSPAVIVERSYTQQKASSKDTQRTVLRITNTTP